MSHAGVAIIQGRENLKRGRIMPVMAISFNFQAAICRNLQHKTTNDEKTDDFHDIAIK